MNRRAAAKATDRPDCTAPTIAGCPFRAKTNLAELRALISDPSGTRKT
jgi:hypothetical protein